MALIDFLKEINDEVKIMNSSDFTIEITETDKVPRYDDPNITFGNLDARTKRCKRLESCVLYVDIRNSAQMSVDKMPQTLVKVYSSFVNSMIAAARYYGGHVRNIIGDRVMVIFDKENCFTNAVNTAILMNTIAHYIIKKNVTNVDFKCGIGIDYGTMLITKTGIVRRNEEKDFYRSLVWLGKPANVASRLTDIANKTIEKYNEGKVQEYNYYPILDEKDRWYDYSSSFSTFLDKLETEHNGRLKHKDEYFSFFSKTDPYTTRTAYPAILMTEKVFDGYKSANPNVEGIVKNQWSKQFLSVSGFGGYVYGSNLYFTEVQSI